MEYNVRCIFLPVYINSIESPRWPSNAVIQLLLGAVYKDAGHIITCWYCIWRRSQSFLIVIVNEKYLGQRSTRVNHWRWLVIFQQHYAAVLIISLAYNIISLFHTLLISEPQRFLPRLFNQSVHWPTHQSSDQYARLSYYCCRPAISNSISCRTCSTYYMKGIK